MFPTMLGGQNGTHMVPACVQHFGPPLYASKMAISRGVLGIDVYYGNLGATRRIVAVIRIINVNSQKPSADGHFGRLDEISEVET